MKKHMPLMLALFLLAALVCPALAEDAASLGVTKLIPISCEASAQSGILDLYCGPTQGFYRHDTQTLDTGKPYVYFGQFDCWAMVAQGTDKDFGPVGWVESALLDPLPDAPELAFENSLAAMVEEAAPMTNTPLKADSAWSISLDRGAEVIILAQLGENVYVQTSIGNVPVRAFIPAASVL